MKTAPLLLLAALPLAFAGCTTPGPSTSTKPAAFNAAAGDQPPRPLVQRQPIYPHDLRVRKITGYAVIGFIVDQEGDVRDPWVIRTNQAPFGRAALEAVAQWKFQPARRAGRTVNARMSVPIVFDFNKEPPKTWPKAGS